MPSIYDEAGLFVYNYLPSDQRDKVMVLGPYKAGLYRTIFHIDSSKAFFKIVSDYDSYNIENYLGEADWVLSIGNPRVIAEGLFHISLNGFTLFRISNDMYIDFSESYWPGVVKSVDGLSFAEEWGTWSSGNAVTLDFVKSLPYKFKIKLIAHAFSSNIGAPFSVSIGEMEYQFSLGPGDNEIFIDLENPEASNTLAFSIPYPISPKNIGLSNDDRELGIGFISINIISVE